MSERGRLVNQILTFIAVGGVGFFVDVGLFNLLTLTVLQGVHGGAILAKVISSAVAILANWVGNRTLTFRGDNQRSPLRESIEFALVSVAGSAIALGCLWVSHYAMHLTSHLADNLSANLIGLALGSIFRFTLYRRWVFATR